MTVAMPGMGRKGRGVSAILLRWAVPVVRRRRQMLLKATIVVLTSYTVRQGDVWTSDRALYRVWATHAWTPLAVLVSLVGRVEFLGDMNRYLCHIPVARMPAMADSRHDLGLLDAMAGHWWCLQASLWHSGYVPQRRQ